MEVVANVTMELVLTSSISKDLQVKEWLLLAHLTSGAVLPPPVG